MSKWNSRKKYQIEESQEETRPKIKVTKMFQRQMYLTILTIIGVTLVVLGNSYAVFTSLNESKGYNTLQVGTLQIAYNDSEDGLGNNIKLNNAFPVSDEEGLAQTPYHFTITNTGSLAADYSVRILDDEAMIEADGCSDKLLDKANIKFTVNGSTPSLLNTLEGTTPPYTIDTGTLQPGERKDFEIKMWIKSDAGNDILGKHYHGKVVIEGIKGELIIPNSNILAVYNYDATNCLTGEETACVELTERPTTYTPGTIVKYKVNDSEIKYFHVISENKEEGTLTMQQRENTIYSIPWYDVADDNSKGPLTALTALENATSGWTNVKDQTYEMGTKTFKTNAFTGCGFTECTVNTYTLGSRTGKARMITVQEANGLGCTEANGSCPNWMNNYLYTSTSYGGTVDQTGGEYGNNYGYWTMSAVSSETTIAMYVPYHGDVYYLYPTTNTYFGARAVVVIDK